MVYLLFAEIISPESRLIEERGAPPLVNVKKYKNALSKTAKKMMMIWIYEMGK